MKWDCVSFQYAALQPPCRSWWGEADAEVKMERVQRELMCGRKKSKSIFEVRRRPVVLMGRRDARSGWKRQSVLTGKARLVIQFVCEKKVRRKISQSLRTFSILPDKGRFWRRTQRFIGNARITLLSILKTLRWAWMMHLTAFHKILITLCFINENKIDSYEYGIINKYSSSFSHIV